MQFKVIADCLLIGESLKNSVHNVTILKCYSVQEALQSKESRFFFSPFTLVQAQRVILMNICYIKSCMLFILHLFPFLRRI